MCGVAGIFGAGETAGQAVAAMTAALARRGPDGEGVECWPGAVFGHRRLAIFDLSDAGRQPMLTPDGERRMLEWERVMIEQALREARGNQTRAAQRLDISRDTLRYRLKKFGLEA